MKNKRRRTPIIVFSLLLIAFGILVLVNQNIEWQEIKPIVISWGMLLVILSINFFYHRHLFTGFAFAGAGIFFILPKVENVFSQIVLQENFVNNYWGALVIYIGILLMLAALSNRNKVFCHTSRHSHCWNTGKRKNYEKIREQMKENKQNANSWFNHSIAFSENEHIFLEPMFYGGEINLAFGSSKLDLRKTDIQKGEVINVFVNVSFGNSSIFIPQDWIIRTEECKVVFGSVYDKRIFIEKQNVEEPERKTLNIIGTVAFGNFEIRN